MFYFLSGGGFPCVVLVVISFEFVCEAVKGARLFVVGVAGVAV